MNNNVIGINAPFGETHFQQSDALAIKREVLNFLKTRWNMYSAAMTNGIRRQTILDWIKLDADFRKEYEQIRDGWIDGAESNIFQQAAHNEKAFVPAIFVLKSWRSERYGDRIDGTVQVNHSFKLSGNIGKVLSDMQLEQLEQAEDAVIVTDTPKQLESPQNSTESIPPSQETGPSG